MDTSPKNPWSGRTSKCTADAPESRHIDCVSSVILSRHVVGFSWSCEHAKPAPALHVKARAARSLSARMRRSQSHSTKPAADAHEFHIAKDWSTTLTWFALRRHLDDGETEEGLPQHVRFRFSHTASVTEPQGQEEETCAPDQRDHATTTHHCRRTEAQDQRSTVRSEEPKSP